MSHRACPKCGGKVVMEKDTMSGRDMREYYCTKCKWSETVDNGTAPWAAMEAAEEAAEKDPPKSDED